MARSLINPTLAQPIGPRLNSFISGSVSVVDMIGARRCLPRGLNNSSSDCLNLCGGRMEDVECRFARSPRNKEILSTNHKSKSIYFFITIHDKHRFKYNYPLLKVFKSLQILHLTYY